MGRAFQPPPGSSLLVSVLPQSRLLFLDPWRDVAPDRAAKNLILNCKSWIFSLNSLIFFITSCLFSEEAHVGVGDVCSDNRDLRTEVAVLGLFQPRK